MLSGANLGSQLNFTGCGTVQNDRISSGNPPVPIDPDEQDLDDYIPDDRIGEVANILGLSTFLNNVFHCNGQMLEQGDYIYINPQDADNSEPEAVEDGHGLLVVGWGTIADCPAAFLIQRTINDLSPTRTDFHPVPYVADFTNAQPPTARPFYCTMAFDDGPTGTYFYRHDWFFFHLPDTITLQPNEVYVDVDWNW